MDSKNQSIQELLDTDKITTKEYNILFSCKNNIPINSSNHLFFKNTLQKVINLNHEEEILYLTGVKFLHFTFHNFSFNLNQKIDFSNAYFYYVTDFSGQKFKKQVYFMQAQFGINTQFDMVEFLDRADFMGATFYNVSFVGSISDKPLFFNNMALKHINLTGAQFSKIDFHNLYYIDNSNKFTFASKLNFENKETVEKIKNYFDKENNISESNKYFTIIQEFYIDTLKKNKDTTNSLSTLSVLYLNKFVSNFGTDWIRPLLVMFIFGYIATLGYAFLQQGTESINFTNSKLLLLCAFLYSILVYYFYHKKYWVAFIASIIVFSSLLLGDSHLREISNDISKLINPLNMFKPKANYFENIAIYGMLVKLGMSVLIYQFIMAFRQNTRRK